MATYGAAYNSALNQWNVLPQADQLRQLGFTPNYTEGFGYDIPSKYQTLFNTGGDGANDAQLRDSLAKVTQFDKQKWYLDQGIVPGYVDQGGPGAGATPDQQQAYSDNWARSFNQFGFNFGGYDDYLKNYTGAGHYENDPTLGKTWVPDNHNFQTWNNSAMAASGAPQGNALDKAVGGFMNSGGLVKAVAGAVLGLGGVMGGGSPFSALTDSLGGSVTGGGSMFSDLPSWAGGAATNPGLTTGASTGISAANAGANMFDIFDPSTWLGNTPTTPDFSFAGGGSDIPQWQRDYFNDFSGGGFDGPGGVNVGDLNNPMNLAPSAGGSTVGGNSFTDYLKQAFGSGAAGGGAGSTGISKLLQSLGLGGGLSDVLGGAVNSAPVLAALNYARNQDPIDTSGLKQLASTYDPTAQAAMYDVQTGQGRNALNASLTNRGVAGSSFGNFDQASYDTMRGLGRSQLINQGAGTQAGIYGLINSAQLQAQQQRNQLLGSGLNALGIMNRPNVGVTLPGMS